MKKYRIKTITNKVTGEKKYKVQVRVLLWWSDCQQELSWGVSVPYITNYYDLAEQYKRDKEIESGWNY